MLSSIRRVKQNIQSLWSGVCTNSFPVLLKHVFFSGCKTWLGKPVLFTRSELTHIDFVCNFAYQPTKFYVSMVQVDLLDKPALKSVFSSHPEVIFESSKLFAEWQSQVECVIHFAALKAVGESFTMPLAYYGNNITGACNLLEVIVTTWSPTLFALKVLFI